MQDRGESALPHFVLQDRGDILIRIAGMDDERQSALPRGRDMGAKDPCSDVTRGAIVVIIEPGFADADAFRVVRERDQAILRHCFGLFMRVMRMCPTVQKTSP